MNIIRWRDANKAGLLRYFTGTPCKNGHAAERFVKSRLCVVCAAIVTKKWRANNPVRAKETPSASPQKQMEYYRKRKERDPDRVRALGRVAIRNYRKRNPERAALLSKEWRTKNIERCRAAASRWKRKDPAKTKMLARVYKSRRRSRKLKSGGDYSTGDVKDILRLQSGKCAYCRAALTSAHQVDHIVPLARGGMNDRSNLQLLCRSCNQRKWAHDPIDFVRKEFGLLV